MSIGDLKSLTKLVLENNENLRILPDSVSNLKNLTVLKIHRSPVVILPKNIINLTALEYVDIFGTKINSVLPSISSVKTFIANTRIELIPQEHSISYRSFVNCYYKIVETVIKFSNKALKEGLLALEEELEFLTVDFFWQGLRITVDGTDAKIIRQLMTVTIEREPDFHRKKLMEIAREGILCIQADHRTHRIIFLLNSMVHIKDNPIDAACSKYLSGDGDALCNIDFKSAILPEEEREEVSFIKRAVALSEVMRRKGPLALEDRLDHNGIAARDVFEYGIPMIIDGYDNDFIDTVLTRLTEHETDPVRKNLALAKKEAVLLINAGENTRIVALTLFAYFDRDVARAAEKELFND